LKAETVPFLSFLLKLNLMLPKVIKYPVNIYYYRF
jgi:hypothetical protein